MANRHFGKVGDVWKHLALLEVLGAEQPAFYAETHAGSAAYALHADPSAEPHADPHADRERRYGVHTYLDAAARSAVLGRSRYQAHLGPLVARGRYPGSGLLAMYELGRAASHLLCDLDPGSTADLARWADLLDLRGRVEVVQADGMRTVAERVLGRRRTAGGALVHVDPFDPFSRAGGGPSAIELAGRLVRAGIKLVYWYGYDRPDQRHWVLDHLPAAAADGDVDGDVWCGDMLVTLADGGVEDGGDLGAGTTPGTGFGVLCANVSQAARERCAEAGRALAAAYAGVPLPCGRPGALELRMVG